MSSVHIIGLAGTNGAGKDAAGELLASRHGYLFISVTELLRDEARRRNLPVERQHLREISAEWRREYGLGVLVDRAYETFRASTKQYKGLVMSSLRNPAEADRIHELGGTMLWIDANPQVRYQRIQANASARNRKGEDDKTFEEFLAEEAAEMSPSEGSDAASLDSVSVKKRSDLTVMNNKSDLEDLDRELVRLLNL